MGTITLKNLKFHAFHGVYEEEKLKGKDYTLLGVDRTYSVFD